MFISKTVPKIGQNLEVVFEEVSSVKNLKKYNLNENKTIAKLVFRMMTPSASG